MKQFFAAVAFVFALVVPASAEGPAWLTDLPKAQAQAKAEGKLVLLNFTGSDFCSSCMRLHKEGFPAPAFTAFAQKRQIGRAHV